MRSIKKFLGYIDGELTYTWEVSQDECKMFLFTVNGIKAKRVDELGMACYYLRDAMLDFLAHEEQHRIMIRGATSYHD